MKINHHPLLSALIFLLMHGYLHTGPALILDLNGVLFTTNTRQIFWHLGPTQLAYYWLYCGKSPYHLKTKLYEILNAIAPMHTPPQTPIYDDAGIPMPLLMQQWLMGTVEPKTILDDITQYIACNRSLFINTIERDLVRKLARLIFDPTLFVASRCVVHDCIRFVQECKKNGISIYILSNFDAVTFKLLYMQHKDIFDQCDGIIISGTQHDMKPSPTIFHTLLNLYDLNAQDCIFIDDQQENIDTAASLGIKTILCTSSGYPNKHPDFNAVRRAYKQHMHTSPRSAHGTIV